MQFNTASIRELLSSCWDTLISPSSRTPPSKESHAWETGNPFERKIEEAVEFTIRNVGYQIDFLPSRSPSFYKGKTILEIGPGQDFGVPLVMMGFGAKAILIDRYLCSWQEDFHPAYYRELRTAVKKHFPRATTKPIDQIIKNNDHKATGLTLLPVGLEEASDIASGTVDISFSNACFEHLFDSEKAILELGRITRSGGLGFHQVDFRDHRSFDKPLEYLTMSDEDFLAHLVYCSCSCGNRLRYTEFADFFERAGFEIDFRSNKFADDAYVSDILARAIPRYREMPVESIRVLSGRFHVLKG